MLILTLLAIMVGLALGLLGGGGSILAVPALTYLAELPPKQAIATSLVLVGSTSLLALVPYARRGHVEWRTGALFAVAAMGGGYLGGVAARWFSGRVLLLLFAVMMLITGIAMFKGRRALAPSRPAQLPVRWVLIEGLFVGAVTGLVGAGGGFLVVPALVILGGMEMHKAVGTSLLVIALKSFAAFSGHASHVEIDIQLTLVITIAAATASLIGAALAKYIPADVLKKSFSVFVLLMAGYIVTREAGWLMGSITWGTALGYVIWQAIVSPPSSSQRALKS